MKTISKRNSISKPTSTTKKSTKKPLNIKPRGLAGLYKGKIKFMGTSNEVFDLGL